MREQFDRFWQVYPKRQQRAVAERAFVHAVYGVKGKKRPPTSPEVIIRGAMAYASAQHGVEDRFVALASTWLNQSRWTDEHHDRPPLRAISGGYQPFQNPADQSAYDEPI